MARIPKPVTSLYTLSANGCWLFTGNKSHNGYGQMKRDGKHIRATHYFLKVYKGLSVPKGSHVDHLCGEVSCVNPRHLEIVSCAVNTQRGRSTKVTAYAVSDIRQKYAQGLKQAEIGGMYGIGQDEVSRIINHKRWTNV